MSTDVDRGEPTGHRRVRRWLSGTVKASDPQSTGVERIRRHGSPLQGMKHSVGTSIFRRGPFAEEVDRAADVSGRSGIAKRSSVEQVCLLGQMGRLSADGLPIAMWPSDSS